MLSSEQRAVIQATVPVLRQHGEAITRYFYEDLFAAHPGLLNTFNPVNQASGTQQRSLAGAILAYAANIDRLEALGGMVERIAHKHGSLEVQPEHYPIVGHHLLRAIRGVLGEAANDTIIDAWGAAYGLLADIMIGRERALYEDSAWAGFKPFRVAAKVVESETITSFHLESADGLALPDYKPGQYISLKVQVPGARHEQIRQYSLSTAPNGHTFRISVRREVPPAGTTGIPAGLISNHLHDAVAEGDTLLVHAPLGDFVLIRHGTRPIVLLSGGSGITPMMAMLETLTDPDGGDRPVTFIHATQRREHHAFGPEVRALAAKRPGISVAVFYETVTDADRRGEHHDQIGRIDAIALRDLIGPEAEVYFCGPAGFMEAAKAVLDVLGVPVEQRHSEIFGPEPTFDAVGAPAERAA